MKLFLVTVLLLAANGPSHASDVGVSVSMGQPGFYGRLDIGGYPPPQVIYRQPRISYDTQPMYLRVPPGHAKHWDKHCGDYNACNQRVFFVKDSWYNNQYVPRYQERNSGRSDDRDYGGRGHDNSR
jgi:hypothetical protein